MTLDPQHCIESSFIDSGTGSSISSESGFRVLITKNWKKIQRKKIYIGSGVGIRIQEGKKMTHKNIKS
jgi:hypothetical protein